MSSQNEASYTYNSNGTVATSTDQDGNESTYSYTAGNLPTITPPSGSGLNATTLTYDSANRVHTVSTIVSGTGSKVTYAYNDFDQITSEVWQNAAGSTVETIDYSYDNDGNLIQIVDNSGTTTYDYDGLNRMTSSWPSTGQGSFSRRSTVRSPRALKVHLILDNYATHKHPNVQTWLAKHSRFELHFTPTSSS